MLRSFTLYPVHCTVTGLQKASWPISILQDWCLVLHVDNRNENRSCHTMSKQNCFCKLFFFFLGYYPLWLCAGKRVTPTRVPFSAGNADEQPHRFNPLRDKHELSTKPTWWERPRYGSLALPQMEPTIRISFASAMKPTIYARFRIQTELSSNRHAEASPLYRTSAFCLNFE